MADAGIKNITIKKDDLPPIGPSRNYSVRYRIISEDKNRVSHWSPVYNVIAQAPATVPGAIGVAANTVSATWTDAPNNSDKEAYDVFVSFDGQPYFYHGTCYNHYYQFLNTGTSTVSVTIQIEGIRKEINAELVIFEGTESLV